MHVYVYIYIYIYTCYIKYKRIANLLTKLLSKHYVSIHYTYIHTYIYIYIYEIRKQSNKKAIIPSMVHPPHVSVKYVLYVWSNGQSCLSFLTNRLSHPQSKQRLSLPGPKSKVSRRRFPMSFGLNFQLKKNVKMPKRHG